MLNLKRKIGQVNIPAIGLGCMNLSHAYGKPPRKADGKKLLEKAVDLGIVHFDTASLYGFGQNELLVGEALKPVRDKVFLASKCGMTGVDGQRVIDGRPQTLKETCERSLRNLQTDYIDLYYLHRWDKHIPVEESVGALSELVGEGKIGAIGLSEVSAETLKTAHRIHPITALQSEYSLWSRNAEIGVLDACRELGVAYVAFSPLGRGFLADSNLKPDEFVVKDIRNAMPKFQQPHFAMNTALMEEYKKICHQCGASPAQVAIAWLLQQSPQIHVIPGTSNIRHLEENVIAKNVNITTNAMKRLNDLVNQNTVHGARYNNTTQLEIDTEEFE